MNGQQGMPRFVGRRVALPEDLQPAFDAMIAQLGKRPSAERLGVGLATLDTLRHGGLASPETVARVADRLREIGGARG